MASKWAKASVNGHKIIINSNSKRVTQCQAQIVKPNDSFSTNKTLKRKRSNGCSRKTLLKNYSNFMKSGPPQRLLFSDNGQWIDFSQDVVEIVKEDFRSKKAAIEVKLKELHIMLDILNMIQVDLKTGLQKPIAWIDDKGSCFFPELYSTCNCHENDDFELDDSKSSSTPEINLQLEIELNGLKNPNLDECVGESNFKRVKVDQESQRNQRDFDVCDSFDQPVVKNQPKDEKSTMDLETAKNMFIAGLSEGLGVDIVEVKKSSGSFMEARLELFEKQIEITQKLRGNANVKYAWLACPRDAHNAIMLYGLRHNNGLKLGRYGYGVHLAAHKAAHSSVTNCDVDEKGVRHMALCRVILGNTELVHPGSKQFYPSDECFDNGVDDLQNPNHYVIWNMNMNTHIYLECAVSFKISPTSEEESKFDTSRVTTNQDTEALLQVECSSNKTEKKFPPFQSSKTPPLDKIASIGSSTPRAPRSPWMPFSTLFDAISAKVAPIDMKLVHAFYESFRGKKMSREQFIQKLRSIVGDEILKATISSLQCKA